MVKLFLSGGGSQEDSKELDKLFIKELSGKLLYVPIAMESRPYSDCLKWLKYCLNPLDFEDIEMITDLKKIKDLSKYSGIYFGGGNTFKLLKEIKESGFDKLLLDFIKENKPVYGGSAGAIILGNNILTSQDKNNVNLEDFNGLNLINDYSIWCHYEENEKDNVKGYVKKNNKVITLPEGSGIIFDGEIRKVNEVLIID